MLNTQIFSNLLGDTFQRAKPLEARVLDSLGDQPGLIICPKLDFSEPFPIGLWVEVEIPEDSFFHLLVVRETL